MKVVPIISVHDALIGHKNIAVVQNIAVGIRGFTNSVTYWLESCSNDDFSPSDMSLYHVGDFDLETGEIIPCDPKILITGKQIYADWMNSKAYSGDDPFEA